MNKNIRVYIALGLIVSAIGMLFFSGFGTETLVYEVPVHELLADGDEAYGRGYRVGGRVVPGTVNKASDRVLVTFTLRDVTHAEQLLPIRYEGILPDTFKEDKDVLVEGRLDRSGVFQATNILTKCASKYEPKYDTEVPADSGSGFKY